ncbi:P-loop containing nucleoside triphosphate hydrolase protein [Auriculariales sp. MPI-PUGE-AT-0066]|nr:P-loop containing nucleoside triphosphate hydrolase protein [Auriculariales sp. MPI-PUGE-AT-0066]
MTTIKCVVVGDSDVGKTCLIMTQANGTFPASPPRVVDGYAMTVFVGDTPYSLGFWDTASPEEYDPLRHLMYPQSDVFLFSFDVTNAASLGNIENKWYPEISHHCPSVPFILVGTKSDLRAGKGQKVPRDVKLVSCSKGEDLARRLGAVAYMECSALRQEGVAQLFEEAVRVATQPGLQEPKRRCSRICTIL